MKKLSLVALESDRQNILDALTKTRAVQLSDPHEIADTFLLPSDEEKNALSVSYDKVVRAIDFITDVLSGAKSKEYYPKESEEFLKNFFVSFNDFISAGNLKAKAEDLADYFCSQSDALSSNKAEKTKKLNLFAQLKPYESLDVKFSDFTDTEKTAVFFGTIKGDAYDELVALYGENEDVVIKNLTDGAEVVMFVVTFKENAYTVLKSLNEKGFFKCPFTDGDTAKSKIYAAEKAIDLLEKDDEAIKKAVALKWESLKTLKIYADYLSFSLEKLTAGETFRRTEKTFILEGFIPEDNVEAVLSSLKGVSDAIFTEVSDPSDDEVVPTLTKNNKLVRQTEFITDTYSVPDYREIDPSHTVFFFFMLFMGVIMADVGYGVLMIVIGLILASKIKVDNGTKRLWNIIAIGGVFTIVFGLLFNSFFGVALLPFRILPDPVDGGKDSVMLVLLGCLGLGVLQIAVGYFVKALNCFKHKKILDGILDGLVWVVFFIGFVFAAFLFLIDYLMTDSFTMDEGIRNFFSVMTMPGVYMVLGSLVIAALTAGRHEKGFGKFSKGFGAIYGLISIMSDILSYARLFGLMLSGMIIAKTFNDMGTGLFSNGVIGIVFGSVVIFIGHAFNIAMGVLGAYIHDSRLQYIEYFSKFYTGEGEKFTPLGSQSKFIYISE